MEEAIVLYPAPPMSHLISQVELGKLMLTHHPNLSIHFLLLSPLDPVNSRTVAAYISRVSSSYTAIKFHHLPPPKVPSQETELFEAVGSTIPYVHEALVNISKSHTVKALVLDFFCTGALSIASELNIPAYYNFTSGAAALSCFLYAPTLLGKTQESFKQLGDTPMHIPGIQSSIPARDMPQPFLEPNNAFCRHFIEACATLPKSSGIIANTFEALEPGVVKAIRDGLCVPYRPNPPLYCVGPLTMDHGPRWAPDHEIPAHDEGGDHCLAWLDQHPAKSVLYLCFGSVGAFSRDQLREIAIGLEKSGQRFLWVVRNPPPDSSNEVRHVNFNNIDPDLESLLPKGFLERTKQRGLVVKSWAPQVAILNHHSTGGFVTHCGWNSTLEAVWAGVPMVAWPLYAEQKVNRVLLVEEAKIAIPILEAENSSDGLVNWEEVEKRATEIMEGERGKLVRERVAAMREAARAALSHGGSSCLNLDNFIQSLTTSVKSVGSHPSMTDLTQ